ncbi:hypothetical protein Slin15195_G086500 [Septoria linicola]|uniref:Uncharacterized protein n=1 Tax=Septoria linicola TaxID=215465 RepID=A0A9Q9B2U8_9PEZI|nr:hypothetical protein Slin14017_G089090 [Septoria linicola]USW55331.1 hypothetical protein Slin15195_G086500 [Septoria linicola]
MRDMERVEERERHTKEKNYFTGANAGSRDPFCARTRAAEAGEFMLERIRRAQRATGEEAEDDEKPLRVRDIRKGLDRPDRAVSKARWGHRYGA